jgi:hypothetical protein
MIITNISFALLLMSIPSIMAFETDYCSTDSDCPNTGCCSDYYHYCIQHSYYSDCVPATLQGWAIMLIFFAAVFVGIVITAVCANFIKTKLY